MKLIERIVKEYTQPLNEARKGKWTDDDKHASWNATAKFAPAQGLVAAKGNIKLDVTDLWYFAYPSKNYIDKTGKQNGKKHAAWQKRYDIKITGQHFDGRKGKIVPLIYNELGINADTEENPETGNYTNAKQPYVNKNAKNKVFISGTKQDVFDFFSSAEWLRSNDNNKKTNKEVLAPLGIQKGDKKL